MMRPWGGIVEEGAPVDGGLGSGRGGAVASVVLSVESAVTGIKRWIGDFAVLPRLVLLPYVLLAVAATFIGVVWEMRVPGARMAPFVEVILFAPLAGVVGLSLLRRTLRLQPSLPVLHWDAATARATLLMAIWLAAGEALAQLPSHALSLYYANAYANILPSLDEEAASRIYLTVRAAAWLARVLLAAVAFSLLVDIAVRGCFCWRDSLARLRSNFLFLLVLALLTSIVIDGFDIAYGRLGGASAVWSLRPDLLMPWRQQIGSEMLFWAADFPRYLIAMTLEYFMMAEGFRRLGVGASAN